MSVPKPDGDKKHMAKESVVAGASLDRKSHAGHPAELAGAGLSSWRLNSERKNSQRTKNVLLASIMQAKIVEVEQCQRDYAQLTQTRNGFAKGGKTPDAIKEIAAQSELDQCHKKLNAMLGDLELIEQAMQENSTAQDDQTRAACLRHLKQLTLLKQNKFVQNALPWDVGAGQCAAFCYEYIHRRRAGATPSLSLSRLPRLPQGLSAQSAMHHATHGARPVVEQDLQRYLHTLQNLQHKMLTNTEHPFFLLVIHCGARGQAHLADANETHAIVLDAGKEHCGIFDPNFGFLPMYFARRHLELPWLLALLFMEYDASRFSLCILE